MFEPRDTRALALWRLWRPDVLQETVVTFFLNFFCSVGLFFRLFERAMAMKRFLGVLFNIPSRGDHYSSWSPAAQLAVRAPRVDVYTDKVNVERRALIHSAGPPCCVIIFLLPARRKSQLLNRYLIVSPQKFKRYIRKSVCENKNSNILKK